MFRNYKKQRVLQHISCQKWVFISFNILLTAKKNRTCKGMRNDFLEKK